MADKEIDYFVFTPEALGTRPRSRRSSIIPYVDETESEPTAQTVLAERGELPAAEIYDLL